MRNLLPLIWRRIPERYRLIGSRDVESGEEFFPQRKISPSKRRKSRLEPHPMPREGKIYSYTRVHAAPTGFEVESPYFLAIIELSNGVKILSQLVDSPAEKVKIGATVKMVFRKIFEDNDDGAIAYGYKFKVA